MFSSSLWGSLSRKLTNNRSEKEAEKVRIGSKDKADYINKSYNTNDNGDSIQFKLLV